MARAEKGEFRGSAARGLVAAAVVVVLSGRTSPARADVQMSAAVMPGLAVTDLRADNAPRWALHLGGQFDVLFLRKRSEDMAVGPYVNVATNAFDTFEAGGGASWLIPAGSTAFVLSAGGLARTSRFGWEPAVSANLFWGSRSFNFHNRYGYQLGLFVQGRYGFGDGQQTDVVAGAQIDLGWAALPFIMLAEAFDR